MSDLSTQAARELASHMREKSIPFATIYYVKETREEAMELKSRLESIDIPKRVVPFLNNIYPVDSGVYMIAVNLTAYELEMLFPERK